MKLIIASGNRHKVREIREILGGAFEEILSMTEAGIDHDTVEDGTTFLENARKKAREIMEISGCAAIADDSGICVPALDGAPGVYSARYCGRHGDDEENNRLLLKNMAGKTDRRAYYTCAMVIAYPDGHTKEAEGYMHGTLLCEGRGTGGFGYDPLFVPEGGEKTLAEYTAEEKNAISHRASALRQLLSILDEA